MIDEKDLEDFVIETNLFSNCPSIVALLSKEFSLDFDRIRGVWREVR